jgi:hypothetical protein
MVTWSDRQGSDCPCWGPGQRRRLGLPLGRRPCCLIHTTLGARVKNFGSSVKNRILGKTPSISLPELMALWRRTTWTPTQWGDRRSPFSFPTASRRAASQSSPQPFAPVGRPLAAPHSFRNSSGSFATSAAIHRASSRKLCGDFFFT